MRWRMVGAVMLTSALVACHPPSCAAAEAGAEWATLIASERVAGVKVDYLTGTGQQIADHHLRLEFALADGRVLTARTMSLGGGAMWLLNHAEALTVGEAYPITAPARGKIKLRAADREFSLAVVGVRLAP